MSEERTIEPDVKQEAVTKDENNVPISRLNEVISERNELREMLESFKSKEEEGKRAKLQEEEKQKENKKNPGCTSKQLLISTLRNARVPLLL